VTATQGLYVRVAKRIHAGLTLDIQLHLNVECGVIFGPSGAGKTSLLRLIAGLSKPDQGRIALDGDVLFDGASGVNRPLRTRRIGMIFQDDLLFPHLTVERNVAFGLEHVRNDEARRRVAEVAQLCGVSHLLERRPETLSGGERQRVGLARALAPRPRLLLCDEPVSALDVESRQRLIEQLRAVQSAEHIPVLYVTHAPAEAVALGSRLFLIREGKLVAEGDPLEVLAQASSGSDAFLAGVQNNFAALIEARDAGELRLRLEGGPVLVVPDDGRPLNGPVRVRIRADDILLAREPVEGLSARNVITGTVERIIPHGTEAEVLVKTGGLTWIVSVVARAVQTLELQTGLEVRLIVKARSCRVSND
jgi:molybdate transport system ATP-binding protein